MNEEFVQGSVADDSSLRQVWKVIDNDKTELPKSTAKPDMEINHMLNAEFTVENEHT